jgi:spermidine/putrescine transport system ATP-binding protein
LYNLDNECSPFGAKRPLQFRRLCPYGDFITERSRFCRRKGGETSIQIHAGGRPGAAADSSRSDVPSVQLDGINKRFGDLTAVHDLALSIERGEFFTLLGPSGCGKTTTLRMVAGFEQPSEGRILLDGVDVTSLPPFRRPTNTVFQSYALFPHLSVEENVAFGLRRRRVDKHDVRRRVAAELELVGLAREAKRRPRQLSGGQQQRVALARALINRPAVLMLDEPLGALDLKLRKGLQLELKRIQREVGITFMYVTHDQEEALTMSDRIGVMNHGVVEQVDSPEGVYDRPRTEFVAGFIGVSNLMPGRVESVNGEKVELRLDSGPLVRTIGVDSLRPGERCHAIVRPEKLQVRRVEEVSPSDGPSVEGVVEAAVYLGTSTQMVVKLPGDVPITVLVPNVDEAERQRLPGAGARVLLSWSPEHTHVLPAERDGPGATGGSAEQAGTVVTPASDLNG